MKKKNRSGISPTVLTIIFTVFAALTVMLFFIAQNSGEKNSTADTETDSGTDTETEISTVTDITVETEAHSETDTLKTETPETETDTVSETEAYVSERVIPVGIYKKNGKKCSLITEYESIWPVDDDDPLWTLDTWTYTDRDNLISDVAYFAVFTSDEEEIDFTYWDETWLDRWREHELDGYKIGFEFEVLLKNGETVTATVLGPEDTFVLEKYFELYLYDCVAHAHDSWYSHITEKTNYDNTHNVMIKITLRDGCYDVEEILMTAFVYNADEINGDGEYIGTNRALCVVKREE